MLKIREAIIVEGRYDKIKLSNIIDALIIETNGFEIFKNKEKLAFIRRLADERGIIILTDSDHSGFQIRHYISAGIPREKIKHLYIPDIFGKERRKEKPSKEGKLGVEGIRDEILIDILNQADISFTDDRCDNPVTTADLYELGLSGTPDAKQNKRKLLKAMDLPELLSTAALISYINSSMTRDEFIELYNNNF